MSTLRATLSNRHATDDNYMGAKVGIIGCGRWGSVHIKTLAQLKQEGFVSEIHGCDINPEKGIEFADLLTTFSTDWQELVNREKLDVIAIVTPAESHHKLAISLLDYCTNLFIEKPISLQETEAAEILAKTQELGGTLLASNKLTNVFISCSVCSIPSLLSRRQNPGLTSKYITKNIKRFRIRSVG